MSSSVGAVFWFGLANIGRFIRPACQKERPQRKGGKLRPLRIGAAAAAVVGAPDYSKGFARTMVPIEGAC
jgi:hypothetical protein